MVKHVLDRDAEDYNRRRSHILAIEENIALVFHLDLSFFAYNPCLSPCTIPRVYHPWTRVSRDVVNTERGKHRVYWKTTGCKSTKRLSGKHGVSFFFFSANY